MYEVPAGDRLLGAPALVLQGTPPPPPTHILANVCSLAWPDVWLCDVQSCTETLQYSNPFGWLK
jgi:hypothetical protein